MELEPLIYTDESLLKQGYKDLGWQNGWEQTFYDENYNEIPRGERVVSVGYSPALHPEYHHCVLIAKHKRHHQVKPSNQTHLVACHDCKIFWQFDAGD